MSVLINVGAQTGRGGVVGFFATIREHLGGDVSWFVVGDRHWGTPRREGPIQRGWRVATDYVRYVALLRRVRPTVAHLNPSFKPLAFVRDAVYLWLARRSGARTLVFFHGWDAGFAGQPVVRWLFRRSYRQADACVVLAGAFGDQLRRLGFAGPIYCETVAVEDGVFLRASAAASTRQTVAEPFNILYLGRVERPKGVFEALDAYAQLVSRWPQATFTIAGDGSALPEVRAQVAQRRLPGVCIRGFVSGAEKGRAFQQAACYILPSYTEGLPTTVLEAMGYGLPVVTRPVGGLVDFFQDGTMGFLVPSFSPAEFAARMEILVQDPALGRRMSAANRAYARERFCASRVAERLTSIYAALPTCTAGRPLPQNGSQR